MILCHRWYNLPTLALVSYTTGSYRCLTQECAFAGQLVGSGELTQKRSKAEQMRARHVTICYSIEPDQSMLLQQVILYCAHPGAAT